MTMNEEGRFYATHSAMTDPGRFAELLEQAPGEEQALARWVRNVIFHELYAEQAGLNLPK